MEEEEVIVRDARIRVGGCVEISHSIGASRLCRRVPSGVCKYEGEIRHGRFFRHLFATSSSPVGDSLSFPLPFSSFLPSFPLVRGIH